MMQEQERSTIGMHQGNALLRVAEHYRTLAEVILEVIQNALDVSASRIWIVVNRKKRSVIIRDNGDGVTKERFDRALASICRSVKGEGKMRKFGMGLVSPLGKCVRFFFTSLSHKKGGEYLQWCFETAKIVDQATDVTIPVRVMPDLQYSVKQTGEGIVQWRTEMRIENYTTDRIVGDMNPARLTEEILDRYNKAMKRLGTSVHITIVNTDGNRENYEVFPREFDGTALPEARVVNRDAGVVVLRLHISPQGQKGKRAKVLVGEHGDDFRLDFAAFARSAEVYLPTEVATAFLSGIFSGDVSAEKLKLSPTRRGFEKNDALIGVCLAMEEWFRKNGKQYFADAQAAHRDERLQELGLRSMRFVEHMLKTTEFQHLFAVVKEFQRGTIGEGHAMPSVGKVLGVQEMKSAAVTTGATSSRGDGEGKPQGVSKKEHLGHTPWTVAGPHGQRRKVVRGNSCGLQFSYDLMPGSTRLWDLDTVTGLLTFNTRHTHWEACEPNDRALMHLQERTAIQALTLASLPENFRVIAELSFEELLKAEVYHILYADGITGRRPGRKSAEAPKK